MTNEQIAELAEMRAMLQTLDVNIVRTLHFLRPARQLVNELSVRLEVDPDSELTEDERTVVAQAVGLVALILGRESADGAVRRLAAVTN
jgi:hypothetical protein